MERKDQGKRTGVQIRFQMNVPLELGVGRQLGRERKDVPCLCVMYTEGTKMSEESGKTRAICMES